MCVTLCSHAPYLFNFYVNSVRLDHLLNEKENLEKEYGEFQREVKHSGLADTAKEIKVLKKVIKNLEVMSDENCIETSLYLTYFCSFFLYGLSRVNYWKRRRNIKEC